MSIKAAIHNGVCTLEIARPERKNALSNDMYVALELGLRAAQDKSEVRAVLLTGQPGIFTSGNDLDDFLQNPPVGQEAPVFRFMTTLSQFSKPLVIAVTGPAIGIGTTMLLHADLVYASDQAVFAMPFVSLGLVPEFASSMLLAEACGHVKAAEKLLLGEPFSSEEAQEMRLINRILPQAEVLPHARRMAERFNALPAGAVQASKRLMRRGQNQAIQATIAAEAEVFAKSLHSAEAKEAFDAFFEKRKPDFSKF
jgi:enoyl-CoA hydratase/carnithine racemase